MTTRRLARVIVPIIVGAIGALGLEVRLAAQLGGVSEADEIELGRQAAAEIEKELTRLDDPPVTEYVTALGRRLAAASERPGLEYHFTVVDAPEVNAFALPGGFIYLNRGLLEAAGHESELAGVLAHEIGHVVARHGAEQMRRAQLTGLGLSVLDRILGRSTGGAIGRVAAQMTASGAFMKFSRDAEREADRLGARNLAATGHDPRGMVTFFEKLDALRERDPNAVERFFASHPSPAERASNIADLIETLGDRPAPPVDEGAFEAVREHLSTRPRPEGDAPAADGAPAPRPIPDRYATEHRDYHIARVFAPVLHQALGPEPRFDYITRFNFDGDWRGDNNWRQAANPAYPLDAYLYYGVTETDTHFLIVYAAFHPRDYKGGSERGALLSEVIREGARLGGAYDPTGLSDDAVLAHENDLEGCLVVAEKRGPDPERARVTFVETLAHNVFLKYVATGDRRGPERIALDGQRAELYSEPKGHGIGAYHGGPDQRRAAENGVVTYVYGGRAAAPRDARSDRVDYELESIYHTLWRRGRETAPETYGETARYEPATWETFAARVTGGAPLGDPVGTIGSAFRGSVGGHMARPPWGWFDTMERDRPLGEWFLDPAGTIKRHFDLDDTFSTRYLHHPFLGIFREDTR